MKAIIQRITSANVVVKGKTASEIRREIPVLLGIKKEDDETKAD